MVIQMDLKLNPSINTMLKLRRREEFVDPSKNQNCENFEVDKYIISKFIIKKIIPIIGIHPYPLDELILMTATVCFFKPTYIFEWGTNIGKSARIFSEISTHFKIPLLIHSIDLPDNIQHIEHVYNKRGLYVRRKKNVFLYQGDGLTTSLDILRDIKNEKNNILFFLDGDHNYNSVFREIKGITENVLNPIIMVHDTFNQSVESHYNIGPYQAISDFVQLSPKKYHVLSSDLGLPGITVLY